MEPVDWGTVQGTGTNAPRRKTGVLIGGSIDMAPRTPRSSPSKARKAAPKTPKPDSKDRYGTFSDAPARIAVIGVGGGGCNAVTRMLEAKPIPGVQYAVVNTDIKSLRTARLAQKIQIGEVLTRGMGAGGNPEVGAQAAEAETRRLAKALRPDGPRLSGSGHGRRHGHRRCAGGGQLRQGVRRPRHRRRHDPLLLRGAPGASTRHCPA